MPNPLTITTPGDRQIVVTRQFDAPRDLVFLCYSKPDNPDTSGSTRDVVPM